MSKECIIQNTSQCVVSMLLVPKSDGTWRMCVYCHVINNNMIKYRHSISRLHDMLDELHGSCIFIKVELEN
jgi:hypothetical protein